MIAFSQNPGQNLRGSLIDKAAFGEDELSALAGGQTVVKILPSKDKREVSVIGIVKLNDVQDADIAAFRDSLSQKDSKVKLGGGRFSSPPVLRDLELLEVENRDIEDLKKCVVGKCNVKLSAAMIRRLHAEVDWNAPDHKLKAADVYKQILVDYVRDYMDRGDSALAEYADHKKPVRLADVYRGPLGGPSFIRGLSPEFADYLRKFPNAELSGVENRLEWSKVKSGLKPIITVTHGASYSTQDDDGSLIMLVTKQVYASHYVDASLALSSLISNRENGSVETYLLFTNTSHSDALGGALSGMAHSVVEREAIEKVTDLLERGKARLEAKAQTLRDPVVDTAESVDNPWVVALSRNWLIRVLGVFLILTAAIYLFRRWRA